VCIYVSFEFKLDSTPHYELLQDWRKTTRLLKSLFGYHVPSVTDNDLSRLSFAQTNSQPILSKTDRVNQNTNVSYAVTQYPSLSFSTNGVCLYDEEYSLRQCKETGHWLVISYTYVQVLEKIARGDNTKTKGKIII